MAIDTRKMLLEILQNYNHLEYIESQDIPEIPLYMDQITTFMDEKLESLKRHDEDKILTKTMINNYSKNHLLPSSDKKKYSKEHIIILTLIYYLKNFLSIKDIETLLGPLTEKYFQNKSGLDMVSIYDEIVALEKKRMKHVTQDIVRSYQSSSRTFEHVPEDEKDELQLFAFLCNLSFDVFIKKMLMQNLIDELAKKESPVDKKTKSNKKKK